MKRAVLLLSGGIDSTSAMLKIKKSYEIKAITFCYGQPAVGAEVASAREICKRHEIHHVVRPLELPFVDPLQVADSNALISPSFVPLRNLTFLVTAAHYAVRVWSDHSVTLVIGCNHTDTARFPDCTQVFLAAVQDALAYSGADLRILAPWIRTSKSQVMQWCEDNGYLKDLLRITCSCYRGTKCGICGACIERAKALESIQEAQPARAK